jgi:hypothetical protein
MLLAVPPIFLEYGVAAISFSLEDAMSGIVFCGCTRLNRLNQGNKSGKKLSRF